MVNFWLLIFLGIYLGWIYIIYWLKRDMETRSMPNPAYWNTICFFTGPVGLLIYLQRRMDTLHYCPSCGKRLKHLNQAICPHCNQKLSPEVVDDEFMGAMRKFDDNLIRIVGKENMDLAVIPDTPEKSYSIKAVKMLIVKALQDNATDIHIEPEQEDLRIRYRIDGVLREFASPPKDIQNPIIPCIKAMSDLDVAERRKPLDGRMQVAYKKHRIDIRVSTSPTIFGEKVALRILDKSSDLLRIDSLGMPPEVQHTFSKMISNPQGMVLVTGPTGSGKTTTIYAALTTIDSTSNNIMTIEDPVEYQLEGVTQIPINPRADVTFASGLRSLLRQDPDIIMVGEVRDKETAEIALRAALTGHLIFTTLHTNDAVGAIIRLLDIGMEPYLISSSVLGVLAQRLVRVNCPRCKTQENPPPDLLQELHIPIEDRGLFMKGSGCPECNFTGYSGRTGIFEILLINDNIRQQIENRGSSVNIRELAHQNGMVDMVDVGYDLARKGITSLTEVVANVRRV